MTTRTSIDAPQPPSAFSFHVIVDGISDPDHGFQEVAGIGPEMDIDQVTEGDENRFVHRLPGPMKHPALVLKRGVASVDSPLVVWCRSMFESDLKTPITTKDIKLYLLDENRKPLRGWSFDDVWPVKWETANPQGTNGKVAIESIELSYSASKRLD